MGHDESDKTEEAGDTDGTGCEKGCNGRKAQAGPFDVEAQAAGHVVAELEKVQVVRADKGQDEADCRIRRNDGHVFPAAGRQSPDHPKQGAVDAVTVKDEDSRDDGSQEGRYGDAGQDDAHDLDAVLPGQKVDRAGSGHGPDKGDGRHQKGVRRDDDEDDEAEEAGTGRDADDMGIGQGISHDGL